MPTCPQCNGFLTHVQLVEDDCPHCVDHHQREATASGNFANNFAKYSSASESRWHSAAKVANLAEAGYLVSRLAGEGIDARLLESESFNALSGAWASAYLLQVPHESLATATEILRTEAEEASGEDLEYDDFGEPVDDEPVHLVFWRPVALMAVAGLATLWLGQRVADPRPRVAPNRSAEAIGDAIESIGKPFVVRSEAGRTLHRLHYRSASHTWYLESDTNGDGKLDRRQRFVVEANGR